MRIGWMEIILILVLVLLLFGSKRLPDLARSLGKSINEFKKGAKEVAESIEKEDDKKDKQ